jgi:hypothetical protein
MPLFPFQLLVHYQLAAKRSSRSTALTNVFARFRFNAFMPRQRLITNICAISGSETNFIVLVHLADDAEDCKDEQQHKAFDNEIASDHVSFSMEIDEGSFW